MGDRLLYHLDDIENVIIKKRRSEEEKSDGTGGK
jgi:hypothetical protein